MLLSNAATNLGFFSKYSVDKIITKTPFTGTFTCSGFNNATFDPGTGSTVITHNLGRACFPELLWSTDGVHYIPAPQENNSRVAALAACSTNTCTIYAYQSIGTGSVTISYILYLLWPN